MRYTKQTFRRSLRILQRGSSAIEMAMLLPILVLMLDGVLEFGLVLHNQSVVTSASNMAVRAGIAQDNPKLQPTQIVQIAKDYCAGNLISFYTTPVPMVEVLQAAEPLFQKPLRVTVHFTYEGILVGGLLSALQVNPELSATAVMYNE